jgi:hypothetical protein
LNDVSLNRFNGQNFLNTGYQHVRLIIALNMDYE